MEPNQINNEVPQVIENSPAITPSRTFPVFIILGVLVIFVSTAAILFYNYQYTSDAVARRQSNYTQRTPNIIQATTAPIPTITATESASPTPATQEEATVDSIMIDEGIFDFSALDQTATGL